MDDSSSLTVPPSVPPPIPTPVVSRCVQHPRVAAIAQCDGCSAYMCATCLFEVPGTQQHMCPTCALAPLRGLSPVRKRAMIIALVLATISTITTALMWAGGLSVLYTELPDIAAVLAERIVVFFPAVAGVALSVGVMDKKLGNPGPLLAAAIWNVILVAAYLVILAIA